MMSGRARGCRRRNAPRLAVCAGEPLFTSTAQMLLPARTTKSTRLSAPTAHIHQQAGECDSTDSRGHRKALGPGVHHDEFLESKVGQRRAHRRGNGWGVGVLELEPKPLRSSNHQQVELGAGVRAPEITLLRMGSHPGSDLCKGEAFPGRTELRAVLEIGLRFYAEQAMQDSRVGDVYLRRLDLAFGEVLVPGAQDPHDKRRGEQFQVTAHGGIRYTERACEFRRVPNLTMPVSKHGPETPEGLGRRTHPEF